MTVQPPSWLAGQIDTLIKALKSTGIWSQLDALWVSCVHHPQAATLNWINPSRYTLIPTGSGGLGAPMFVPYRGFAGSGQGWLATGYTPGINGVKYTLNSASIWAWQNLPITLAANSYVNMIMGTKTASYAYLNLKNSGVSNQVVISVNDDSHAGSAVPAAYNGFFGAQVFQALR
jgi:hypothetical protein